MTKSLFFIGIGLLGTALSLQGEARAEAFSDKCTDIAACARYVGEMLGQKYVFSNDVKGMIHATPNLEINRENAELLFTVMLHDGGYTRVPLGEPNTFQIMRERDARDSTVPLLKADQRYAPHFPNNWDLMTLQYKATNAETVEHIARTARSFMPANSRIIPSDVSGTLLVTDNAANLKKLYEIIKELDQKPTPEIKKRWEEMEKIRQAEMRERRKAENTGAVAPQSGSQPSGQKPAGN